MSNQYMSDYWKGYRTAKMHVLDFGCAYAREQWRYGLQGRTDAFCKGYLNYLKKLNKE